MSKKVMKKIVSIEKQELSAEKVELSSIDDLKSLEKEYFKTFDTVRDVRRIGVELKKKAQSGISDLNKIENKIKQELNLFEQKAKDLGVDVKGVKEYQSLNQIVKDNIPEYMRIFKQALKVDTL